MCQYCDEKSLPCLMCGRACMEYQLDRSRCRGCATHNQPPHTWPVFTHCPYCGRDLSKKQEDDEMAEKYIWTEQADDTIRYMIEHGRSVAEICDALGITVKQLRNRVYVIRQKDQTFPRLCRDRIVRDCSETTEESVDTHDVSPAEAESEERQPSQGAGESEPALIKVIEEKDRLLKEALKEIDLLVSRNEMLAQSLDLVTKKLENKIRTIAEMAEYIYGGFEE